MTKVFQKINTHNRLDSRLTNKHQNQKHWFWWWKMNSQPTLHYHNFNTRNNHTYAPPPPRQDTNTKIYRLYLQNVNTIPTNPIMLQLFFTKLKQHHINIGMLTETNINTKNKNKQNNIQHSVRKIWNSRKIHHSEVPINSQ